jgi:small-conductance mechanosensitive channel
MKTGRSLFVSSAAFGLVVGAVYWLSSRHPAGTVLLGLMMLAMAFTAAYMFVAEANANLSADRKDATFEQSAGEDVGIFTAQTAWPFLAALAVFLMLLGMIWSPALAGAGFIALLLILWRLGAESNRRA